MQHTKRFRKKENAKIVLQKWRNKKVEKIKNKIKRKIKIERKNTTKRRLNRNYFSFCAAAWPVFSEKVKNAILLFWVKFILRKNVLSAFLSCKIKNGIQNKSAWRKQKKAKKTKFPKIEKFFTTYTAWSCKKCENSASPKNPPTPSAGFAGPPRGGQNAFPGFFLVSKMKNPGRKSTKLSRQKRRKTQKTALSKNPIKPVIKGAAIFGIGRFHFGLLFWALSNL